MSSRAIIRNNLAAAFLAGVWSVDALVKRGSQACGRRHRWLRPLARRVLAAFATPPTNSPALLRDFLDADAGFCQAWMAHASRQESLLERVYWASPAMAPLPGPPASWSLPILPTEGALADWLGLTPGELAWFADCQRRLRQTPPGPLHHYTYRWLIGRRKVRLLEMPKSRLKALQRRLLHELLDLIPPHPVAHGYRPGRSVLTWLSPHAGRRIVVHLDLRDFFPSVGAARVQALFRAAGYPETVARLLTGLCTHCVPPEVLRDRPMAGSIRGGDRQHLLAGQHLPQGAPTSPALANLCAYRLDCRLAGLARAAGAAYTRYADDLVFSGDEQLERAVRGFHVHVCRIALEEGFEVNTRKSHFMRQGVRQQAGGVVVNVRPNIKRPDYDRLKAILTNCIRQGPEGQNHAGHPDFRAHLAGRIDHVAQLNPARGQHLRGLFEQIRWPEFPHR